MQDFRLDTAKSFVAVSIEKDHIWVSNGSINNNESYSLSFDHYEKLKSYKSVSALLKYAKANQLDSSSQQAHDLPSDDLACELSPSLPVQSPISPVSADIVNGSLAGNLPPVYVQSVASPAGIDTLFPRVVCHFSCGAASAVATKLAIEKYGKDAVTIVNIHIAEEHPDNQRFLKDCEKWFGKEIQIIKDTKFNASIYEVFRRSRFIRSPMGAPCTTRLKRMIRAQFSRPDDINIYGFTVDEKQRADDFEDRNPDIQCDFTLIESGFNKADCLGFLELVGIELPVMYRLGYNNNNCIGCVKGGMGYWNKIRKDFPDVFFRMSQLEREIGHSILKDKIGSVYLDELSPDRGRIEDEPDIECSFICRSAFDELGA